MLSGLCTQKGQLFLIHTQDSCNLASDLAALFLSLLLPGNVLDFAVSKGNIFPFSSPSLLSEDDLIESVYLDSKQTLQSISATEKVTSGCLLSEKPQSVWTELSVLVCPSTQPGLPSFPPTDSSKIISCKEVNKDKPEVMPLPCCSLKKWQEEPMVRPGSSSPLLFHVTLTLLCWVFLS